MWFYSVYLFTETVFHKIWNYNLRLDDRMDGNYSDFFILAFLNYIQNQHTKPLLKWKHFVLVWADLLKQFLDNTLPNVVIKMNIESTGAQSDKTVIVCFRLLH